MIKIRLTRRGAKKAPFYRVVAIDEKNKREGKPQDIIGYWQPKKKLVKIDEKKLSDWIKKGAKITKKVNELINQR